MNKLALSKANVPGHEELTDDQVSEFKEAFELFDKDGDGKLSPEERKTAMAERAKGGKGKKTEGKGKGEGKEKGKKGEGKKKKES